VLHLPEHTNALGSADARWGAALRFVRLLTLARECELTRFSGACLERVRALSHADARIVLETQIREGMR
jgi:hypothetical protein